MGSDPSPTEAPLSSDAAANSDAPEASPLQRRLDRWEGWLKERRGPVLWTLLAIALLLRVVAFVELNDGPSFVTNKHDQMDMAFFEKWGQKVADGDFMQREPFHPLHDWHSLVAAQFLRKHPEILPGGRPIDSYDVNNPEELAALTSLFTQLWNTWYGGTQYHQEPGYPYLIGLIYMVFGSDMRWVFLVQMLAGAGSVVLLYLITRSRFGDLAGVLAAGLLLLYGPLLYYEFLLLRTALITFVSLALIYLADRLAQGAGTKSWFGFGLAGGAAVALKTTFGLFAAAATLALVWPLRKNLKLAGARLGLVVAGGVLALAPFMLRNLAVDQSPLALTSVGPITFAVSNVKGYPVDKGWWIPGNTDLLGNIMGYSRGEFGKTIEATVDTHNDLSAYFGLLLQKFSTIWHWYELKNNSNYYFWREQSTVLGTLTLSFVVIAALGLVGVGYSLGSARQRKLALLFLVMLFCAILPQVMFYTLSRFRAPMVPILASFAGLMIVQGLRWLARGQRRPFWWSVGVLAVLCLAMWSRAVPRSDVRREQIFDEKPPTYLVPVTDYQWYFGEHYAPKLRKLSQQGDWDGYADLLVDFLDRTPDYVRKLSPTNPPRDINSRSASEHYMGIYSGLATALERSGRPAEAQRARARAAELNEANRIGTLEYNQRLRERSGERPKPPPETPPPETKEPGKGGNENGEEKKGK